MNKLLRKDADEIIRGAIAAAQPAEAVRRALEGVVFPAGRLILVAVGKAAWTMASAAVGCLERRPDKGVVITKYGHSRGAIDGLEIFEAGHPVPDENSVLAARAALDATEGLSAGDSVLLLLSGGGSALFEAPVIPLEMLQPLTDRLLSCGADITEINTVRKHLSLVKGGGFARHCAPARVFQIILSDVLGDRLDMIASGPAAADSTTADDARAVIEKYGVGGEENISRFLIETPKEITNSEAHITGSVSGLCSAAREICVRLGYEPFFLTDRLSCEAREAGRFMSAIAGAYQNAEKPLAFIAGGETVVHITGGGKGGRNQELALAAAEGLSGLRNTAIFSVGSDGTDGPTDAAGGYVDGDTLAELNAAGISAADALADNDSYNALSACGGLIITGPTGTNVNDLIVLLIR